MTFPLPVTMRFPELILPEERIVVFVALNDNDMPGFAGQFLG